MLHSFNIDTLVDVRSFPGSRRYPQFNKAELELSMPLNNIEYLHLKELGGRRKPSPDSKNTRWRHPAFRAYADYMASEDFNSALGQLEVLAKEKRVAYMCSEAVWWRCHRGLISDALKSKGWEVMHIMGISKAQEHPYTSAAIFQKGQLSYTDETLL
jgi:uncharacterized protein (DUF488 family)